MSFAMATPDTPPKRRVRLDLALVASGLESSRERAQRLILAGEVTVNGQIVTVPSTTIPADAALAAGKPLPYAGRGGLKLAHALDRFALDITGRVCLDAGASTGGFTDVLLQRGAARVYALDVGRGLLAWSLRNDPRVIVMEGVNVRYLAPPPADPVARPNAAPTLPERVSLATVDVAFISLRLVLPAITGVLTPQGDMVALVKPQFEAGQASVGRGGVVRDPAVHRAVLQQAIATARACGLTPAGLTASPVRGRAGNVEFLLWSRHATPDGLDETEAVEGALAEAGAIQ